jgi:hypothetical protein
MAITVLPTKAIGSLGPVKTDNRAYLRPTSELQATELEAIKQQIIDNATEIGLTDGSTVGSLREAAIANAVPSTDLIWAWNGVDLTQFTDGATPELDTSTGAALSVENSPEGAVHKVLRATAGTGSGFSQWVIDEAEFPTLPSRYVLEISCVHHEDGASGYNIGSRVGFSHFCEYVGPGDVNAYSLCQYGNLNSYLQVWTRGTTFASAGGTPSAVAAGTALSAALGYTHRLEVRHQIGATYDMYYALEGHGGGLASVVKDYESDAATLDFDAGAYNNVTPNTFGLAANWSAGQHFVDFGYIRIRQHPADRS